MFVILSKLLPLFIYPLGLTLVLLVAALLWRRARVAAIVVALVVLWLGSTRLVAYTLVRSLESRHPGLAVVPDADAIVVLGGGTKPFEPPRPMTEVNEAGDRLLYGAALYRQGKADVVLVTGGGIEWLSPEGAVPEAEAMALFMRDLGVPADALWLESASRNTYENARYSREMLAAAGREDILLVTSALHMPRSLALFEKQGLRVTPAPADYLVSDADWDHLWHSGPLATLISLLPDAEYLAYTSRALKEYTGILVYGLRGWL